VGRLPADLKERQGGRKGEGKRRQLSLPPGNSGKRSALQPETCPKYFTPLLLHPQLWGSGGWHAERRGPAAPEAAPRQEVWQGEQAGKEHNRKHHVEKTYIPQPASATAQPTLLLRNNCLFRAPPSAFNRVLQRELTIPPATTATWLERSPGWGRSPCRCCRSAVETGKHVCTCVHSALEQTMW